MATKVTAAAAAAKAAAAAQAKAQAAQTAQLQQQQLALRPGALTSPYDGTAPALGLGGYPLEAGTGPGSLAGMAGNPQVNATNQSALAPNGDINQTVTNENKYENKYYNIITSTTPQYGVGGGYYNPAYGQGQTPWGMQQGYGNGQQCFIDPYTGVMMCRQEGGIIGWIKSLFRGY